MKNALTTKSHLDTIDNHLREHGFTISRDVSSSKNGYTVRKDAGNTWVHHVKFHSKSDLVEFANNLK